VALFLLGACDTHVPILHIEATGETNVLVGPKLNIICELWAGGLVIFGLLQECKGSYDSHQRTVWVLIGPVLLLPRHGVHAHCNCHCPFHPRAVGTAGGTVVELSAGTAAGTLEGEEEKRCMGLEECRS
jgi:hypothetical protein